MSAGFILGSFAVAYALSNMRAIQEGFRQGGDSQAARLTIRVEAGLADQDGLFVPDNAACAGGGLTPNTCAGGALTFSIKNTGNIPLRVNNLSTLTIPCGIGAYCPVVKSNKNTNGTFAPIAADGSQGGTCAGFLTFVPPANFNHWPIIPSHSTLQVNGTDTNRLGAGLAHLNFDTPQGCQGATFIMNLFVDASDAAPPNSFSYAP
jgi:hypothetical protein